MSASKPGVLRGVLIGALGTIGDDDAVLIEARRLFAGDRQPGHEIDADIAASVIGVVARQASAGDFAEIVDRFRHPLSPLERRRYEYGLGAVTDRRFAAEVLEMCRTEIRSQDAPYLLAIMMGQHAIGPATWEFVVEHFDELEARYPSNSIDRMLEGIATLADLDAKGDPVYLDAVRTFVASKISGGRLRPVTQSVEQLEINLRLASRLVDSLGPELDSR